jgi:hypothetical protein
MDVPLKTPEALSVAAIFTPYVLIWGSAFFAFLLVAGEYVLARQVSAFKLTTTLSLGVSK